MSILNVGSRCTTCSLVDFLPTKCPYCSLIYCGDHIASHECVDVGPSTHPFAPKQPCTRPGCDRSSIEGVSGITSDQSSGIARQIRCSGCNGAFCTSHRSQDAHDCPAPRTYNVLGDAALRRKEHAKRVMAEHFPDRPVKDLQKPVAHTRDPIRLRAPTLPPATPLPPPTLPSPPPAATPKTKTKEEKLWEIQLKKIKMSAKPLDPRQKPEDGRVFFETSVASQRQVNIWMEKGTFDGSREKVWVNVTTPVGRILDILKERNKTDKTRLVALYALSRTLHPLDNSAAASTIPDGSLVVLVD